jgi:putative FmdB family regulatory protein
MPICEYQCGECDRCFELLTTSSKDRCVSCPKCGATQVKRLLSATCLGASNFKCCGPGVSGGF